jgi:aromatic ring-opening dioxygenase LigB subunit
MLSFVCISPHAPILLPSVGSKEDRAKVKKTIESLESLGKNLKEINPDEIVISSPHPDWGFNVPLSFLAPDFKGKISPVLMELETPKFYFEAGKKLYDTKYKIQDAEYKIAFVASGDTSHCLKKEGPYGFENDGPKFDESLVKYLKEKNVEKILNLDEDYPRAGECGLRSFSFLLGILEAFGKPWEAEVLSYEGPFGVGYLVVNFKL